MRCAAFSGARNRSLYVPDDEPIENISQEEYLNKNATSSAIGHFHGNALRNVMNIKLMPFIEKLFRLKTMMRTARGKALAIERDRFMQSFVDQIDKEYNIEN